jgi:hypothetical protein
MSQKFSLNVNGTAHSVDADPDMRSMRCATTSG